MNLSARTHPRCTTLGAILQMLYSIYSLNVRDHNTYLDVQGRRDYVVNWAYYLRCACAELRMSIERVKAPTRTLDSHCQCHGAHAQHLPYRPKNAIRKRATPGRTWWSMGVA